MFVRIQWWDKEDQPWESLHECYEIRHHPGTEPDTIDVTLVRERGDKESDPHRTGYYEDGGPVTHRIYKKERGAVFVMNDQGQTVDCIWQNRGN